VEEEGAIRQLLEVISDEAWIKDLRCKACTGRKNLNDFVVVRRGGFFSLCFLPLLAWLTAAAFGGCREGDRGVKRSKGQQWREA
jgi:hypothetical protein